MSVGLHPDSVKQFLTFFTRLEWHYGRWIKTIDLINRVERAAQGTGIQNIVTDLLASINAEIDKLNADLEAGKKITNDDYNRQRVIRRAIEDLRPAVRLRDVLQASALLLPHCEQDFRIVLTMVSLVDKNVTWSTLLEFVTHDYASPFYTGTVKKPSWQLDTPMTNPNDEKYQEYVERYENFWNKMYILAEYTNTRLLSNIACPWFTPRLVEEEKDGEAVHRVLSALADDHFNMSTTNIAQTLTDSVKGYDYWTTIYVRENNVEGEKALEVQSERKGLVVRLLKRIQKLHYIAINFPTAMPALLKGGFDDPDLIANMSETDFVNRITKLDPSFPVPISVTLARRIWKSGSDIAAEDAQKRAEMRDQSDLANPQVLTTVDPNTAPTDESLTSRTLMGLGDDMDLVVLDDRATTVTSPAAYFIDLLQLLLATNATLEHGGNPVSTNLQAELLKRRPDLPYLELSAENTLTAQPYLDLVNELMVNIIYATDPRNLNPHFPGQGEKYIYPPAYENVKPGEESGDLLAKPIHQDYRVYDYIDGVTPIGSLPYDPHLDRMRVILRAIGTSLLELMVTFPRVESELGAAPERAKFDDYYTYTEYLNMAGEEIELLLTTQQNAEEIKKAAKELWNFPENADDDFVLETLSNVKEVLSRTGIEVSELSEILKAEYINPNRLMPNGRLRHDQELVPGPIIIRDLQPEGDKRVGILSHMRLLHLNGNKLTWLELHTLQVFIRVWKKVQPILNTTAEDLGYALTLFMQAKKDARVPLHEALGEIDFASQIMKLTDLDFSRVIACFGQISIPLYRQIFVKHELAVRDPVFELGQDGMYLNDASLVLSQHTEVILAALRISKKDFEILLNQMEETGGSDDRFDMFTVSTWVRYLTLCKIFGIQIKDIDDLKAFLTAFGGMETPRAMLNALKKWSRLTEKRFTIGEAIFVATAKDPDELAPQQTEILAMAKDLATSQDAIKNEYPDKFGTASEPDDYVSSEATSDVVLKSASLLFGPPTAKEVLDFLEGRTVVTIKVDPPSDAPEKLDPEKLGDLAENILKKLQLSNGVLTATGLLTDAELNKVKTLSDGGGWAEAVDKIKLQAREFYHTILGDVFANDADKENTEKFFLEGDEPTVTNPDGSVESPGTAGPKRSKFMIKFTPFLRSQLKRASVTVFVTGSILQGMTAETIDTLLSFAYGVNEKWPSVEQFLRNVHSSVYDPKAESGFDGYLTPDASDSYRFMADASSGKVKLDIDGKDYELSPLFDGSSTLTTTPIELKGGKAYKFIAPKGISNLVWKAARDQRPAGPVSTLLSEELRKDFTKIIFFLKRLRMVIDAFKLDPTEVTGLNPDLTWGLLDYIADYDELKEYVIKATGLSRAAVSANLSSIIKLYLPTVDKNGNVTDPKYDINAVANATGWPIEQIKPYYTFDPSKDPFTWPCVLQVMAQIRLSKRLAFNIDMPYKWVANRSKDKIDNRRQYADEIALLYDNSPRLSYEQWKETAADTVYNILRDNHRRALIGFLLNQKWLQDLDVNDGDALFEYLLIDPQMTATFQTSRMNQGLGAIQLFIQRCLLGLEFSKVENTRGILKIDDTASFNQKWAWMGRYTLWEANRKVFLFPENWVTPSLRDDKSEFFQAFESEIHKDNLSEETITRAVMTFIEDSYNIRSLSIQATYTEKDSSGNPKVTYFIARTIDSPWIFYWRQYTEATKVWTPWKKIDTAITVIENQPDGQKLAYPGSYIVPYKYKDRMLMFLPELLVKVEKSDDDDKPSGTMKDDKIEIIPPKRYARHSWEVSVGWTELKNGKWTPKSVCGSKLTVKPEEGSWLEKLLGLERPLPDVQTFRFFVGQVQDLSDTDTNSKWVKNILNPWVGNDGLAVWVEALPDPKSPSLPVGAFVWMHGTMSANAVAVNVEVEHLPPRADDPLSLLYPIRDFHVVDGEDTAPDHTLWPESSIPVFHKVYTDNSTDYQQKLWETAFKNRTITVKAAPAYTNTNYYNDPDLSYTVSKVKDVEFQFRNLIMPGVMVKPTTDEVYKNISSISQSLANNTNPLDIERRQAFGALKGATELMHELHSPSAIYNWELGFHIPAMLMDTLLELQQFELALKYARYIFDPRPSSTDANPWKWPPFATKRADNESAIGILVQEWKENPFQPHLIARTRPLAYKKWVVMKYIEILIAYGDMYFRQPSLEAVPLAIQLYVEAAHVFGGRGQMAPRIGSIGNSTYNALQALKDAKLPAKISRFDDLNNIEVDMDYLFPFAAKDPPTPEVIEEFKKPGSNVNPLGRASSVYFKYYSNPKFVEIRSLIDDRLFKIRNGLDIDGNPRKLALWDPPLDPGALVKAAAAGGIALSSVLNGLDGPMPNYRFLNMMQKALEICAELKNLAGQYLSIKEKTDSEALQALQARQNSTIQGMLLEMKQMELEQAEKDIEVLQDARQGPKMRLTYYRNLLGENTDDPFQEYEQSIDRPDKDDPYRMNTFEKIELGANIAAHAATSISEGLFAIAAFAGMIPNIAVNAEPFGCGVSTEYGGNNVSRGLEGGARLASMSGAIATALADTMGRMNNLKQQAQERKLQANIAGYELLNIDKQIERAQLHVKAARHDIEVQKQQIDHATQIEDFYRSKWTNQQLYIWMGNAYKNFFYKTYTIAYDIAKKAERAYQFEAGPVTGPDFIQFGYWDNEKAGLGSAEALYIDLKRLEQAYLLNSPWDYEISKKVSLRQLRPLDLMTLRETGYAEFTLPETLFDMDFAGHYARRIKSVSVSIPCVVNPYTSVSCTLRLLEHKYRTSPIATNKDDYASQSAANFRTDRIPVESIAVSQGIEDSGSFDFNFSSERFAPFEGAGAVSKWRLELSEFRQFDYDTITDVILHVKYTSKSGGDQLKKVAVAAAKDFIKSADSGGLFAIFDLKNDFPSEWRKFAELPTEQDKPRTLLMKNLGQRLPFFTKSATCTSSVASILTRETRINPDALSIEGKSSGTFKGPTNVGDHGMSRYDATLNANFNDDWTLTLTGFNEDPPLEKMLLVVKYTASIK